MNHYKNKCGNAVIYTVSLPCHGPLHEQIWKCSNLCHKCYCIIDHYMNKYGNTVIYAANFTPYHEPLHEQVWKFSNFIRNILQMVYNMKVLLAWGLLMLLKNTWDIKSAKKNLTSIINKFPNGSYHEVIAYYLE